MKWIQAGGAGSCSPSSAGSIAAVAIGLVATDRVGEESRRRHAAGQPLRRLRVPRPLQAVRGRAPGRDDQGGDPELRDHHTQLAQHIATGAGAADVEAIEVGFIPQFTAQPQNFVDLRKYGADAIKSRWLPWKYQQAVGKGGAVVGLGTDVGSLAICYRTDLFAKAGLPTATASAVSKLVADVAGVHQHRQALPGEGPEGHVLLRLGLQRLQRDGRPAQPGVLQRRGQGDRGDEPEREGGVQPGDLGRAGRRVRRTGRVQPATGTPATRRACSRP